MTIDEPCSPESEALDALVRAWRSRDFIDQHAGELTSTTPCPDCLRIARAVMFGQVAGLESHACADVRRARETIKAASDLVKKVTGDVIR